LVICGVNGSKQQDEITVMQADAVAVAAAVVLATAVTAQLAVTTISVKLATEEKEQLQTEVAMEL